MRITVYFRNADTFYADTFRNVSTCTTATYTFLQTFSALTTGPNEIHTSSNIDVAFRLLGVTTHRHVQPAPLYKTFVNSI